MSLGRCNLSRSFVSNSGAAVAKGEYFIFLDAGVFIPDPQEFFPKAISYFESNKNLAGLTGMLKVLPECETYGDRIVFGIINTFMRIQNNILHMGNAVGKFQMVKAEAFRAIHGFREDLITAEDYDLFRRLAKIGRTRAEKSLIVYHNGRREHALGWPRLLMLWSMNLLSYFLRGKSLSREWTPIR